MFEESEKLKPDASATDIANFCRHINLAQFRLAVEKYDEPNFRLQLTRLLNYAVKVKPE